MAVAEGNLPAAAQTPPSSLPSPLAQHENGKTGNRTKTDNRDDSVDSRHCTLQTEAACLPLVCGPFVTALLISAGDTCPRLCLSCTSLEPFWALFGLFCMEEASSSTATSSLQLCGMAGESYLVVLNVVRHILRRWCGRLKVRCVALLARCCCILCTRSR